MKISFEFLDQSMQPIVFDSNRYRRAELLFSNQNQLAKDTKRVQKSNKICCAAQRQDNRRQTTAAGHQSKSTK